MGQFESGLFPNHWGEEILADCLMYLLIMKYSEGILDILWEILMLNIKYIHHEDKA